MLLKDKNILITGVSSGFGASIAELFLREGASVWGVALDQTYELESENFNYSCLNIMNDIEVEMYVSSLKDHEVAIDCLVNCAGITGVGTIRNTPMKEFRSQFELNVFALYNFTQSLLPIMDRSEAPVLINIVSELGVKAAPNRVAYSSAKAAVEMLTRSLAIDLGPHYRVNGILPGLADTPMTAHRFTQAEDPAKERQAAAGKYILNKLTTPEDVANGALFLASALSSNVTGSMLAVCGGGQITTCNRTS